MSGVALEHVDVQINNCALRALIHRPHVLSHPPVASLIGNQAMRAMPLFFLCRVVIVEKEIDSISLAMVVAACVIFNRVAHLTE